MINIKNYKLVIPDESYERQYTEMMDRWESVEDDIQPHLLRRYSDSQRKNIEYSKWLEWCKDDRTTASMLSTGVPCTLYFLVDDSNEIYGAIVINSAHTHMGHLHAGIAPWHRDKGIGTAMLKLALDICKDIGFSSVEIVPLKSNKSAIKIILNNGGLLKETFFENGKWFSRFIVELTPSNKLWFTQVTKENPRQYKKLRKIFAKYKIRVLRNHGESPCGKKTFYKLFDSIVSSACERKTKHFIVMQSGKALIGFASIETSSTDVVTIPYSYGAVNDFYISPKYRRKGYGRILNNHIENIFRDSGTITVLLSPDPVSGIDFWKAMGYCDTGIHQGWGRHFVYIKHLTEKDVEIENAISALVTPTDLITVNPYNKAQIKKMHRVWKKYCRENNKKYRKSTVRKMAFKARENKDVVFKALYSQGRIIGFVYKDECEINYGL